MEIVLKIFPTMKEMEDLVHLLVMQVTLEETLPLQMKIYLGSQEETLVMEDLQIPLESQEETMEDHPILLGSQEETLVMEDLQIPLRVQGETLVMEDHRIQ